MRWLNFAKRGGSEPRPLAGDESPSGKLTLSANFRSSDPSAQVLVVDDDPVIRNTTASRLRAAGYEVHTASDCSEALGAVAAHKPQFILLDLTFPPDVANGGALCWDGFRLMAWLRGLANTRGARFIVISGDDSAQTKEQARRAGAIAFFPKPIDHRELLAVFQQESTAGEEVPRPWWAAFFNFF